MHSIISRKTHSFCTSQESVWILILRICFFLNFSTFGSQNSFILFFILCFHGMHGKLNSFFILKRWNAYSSYIFSFFYICKSKVLFYFLICLYYANQKWLSFLSNCSLTGTESITKLWYSKGRQCCPDRCLSAELRVLEKLV